MNQMILEATQIIDNMIAEYYEELKKLHDLKEKEANKEKQRTIIGLFLYINEIIDNLERIKEYLKSLGRSDK